MQVYINETTRKPWPRWAISPEGQRAIFACQGDIPLGWKLEIPLPDKSAGEGSDAVVAELMRQVSDLREQLAKKGKAA
jgi:hypothetical protein